MNIRLHSNRLKRKEIEEVDCLRIFLDEVNKNKKF